MKSLIPSVLLFCLFLFLMVFSGAALSSDDISFTVGDSDNLTYTASNLPDGATFIDRTFTWTPRVGQAGTYVVEFRVTNAFGSDTENVTFTVKPKVSGCMRSK